VRWGPLEQADINDAAAMDAICARWQPVAVLHFAGLIAAGESVVQPALYYRANLGGLLSVIDCCRRNHIRRIVFSSSAAVYGEPSYVPIDEQHPTAPMNPYGHSKLMGEQLLSDSSSAYDLRTAALRYFNACGADPK
jgi:UDP-glucose 4-epimerase